MLYIAADHAGFEMKQALVSVLVERGVDFQDLGADEFDEHDDYTEVAALVGERVSRVEGSMGVIVCGSGAGVAVVAGKFVGVRPVLGYEKDVVRAAREDDDVNVLCLGARYLDGVDTAVDLIDEFLGAEFAGEERFVRRVNEVGEVERRVGLGERVLGAILALDVSDARSKLERIRGYVRWVQLDVMDGELVEAESVGLDEFDRADFDGFLVSVHLMVARPMEYLDDLMRLGVRRVVVHVESGVDIGSLRKSLGDGVELFVALNPETELEQVTRLGDLVDGYLVMGVHPGASGQEMVDGTVERVKELRLMDAVRLIGVDGGVTVEKAAMLREVGADYVAAASSIFGAEDIGLAVARHKEVWG